MPKARLIIALISLVAIVIVGLAIYLLTHFSTINLSQGIALIAIAIAALLIVMVLLVVLTRSIAPKKKSDTDRR